MLGEEGRDLGGVYIGEITFGAGVAVGAGEPDEATSCVHDERESLRRSSEAEGDSVAAVAVGEKRGFDYGR